MKKLLTVLKVAPYVVVAMCLVFAALAVRDAFADRMDTMAKLQDKLHQLDETLDLVQGEKASQRKILDAVKTDNADLAGALKSSDARVNRLQRLVLRYEKELADIQAQPVETVGSVQRVNFKYEFPSAHLAGWFEADVIDNPRQWHFELQPKEQTVQVVDTDVGSIATSTTAADVKLTAMNARARFGSGLAWFAGMELSTSAKPGVMIGASIHDVSVYGRVGNDPAFGVFKTWRWK